MGIDMLRPLLLTHFGKERSTRSPLSKKVSSHLILKLDRLLNTDSLEPSGTSASKKNPEIERRDINIRCIQIAAKGELTITPVHQLSGLRNKSTAKSIQGPVASIFVVETASLSLIETLSEVFGCGIEVFNYHLKRASEDVEIVLPSARQSQSHVVIPYTVLDNKY